MSHLRRCSNGHESMFEVTQQDIDEGNAMWGICPEPGCSSMTKGVDHGVHCTAHVDYDPASAIPARPAPLMTLDQWNDANPIHIFGNGIACSNCGAEMRDGLYVNPDGLGSNVHDIRSDKVLMTCVKCWHRDYRNKTLGEQAK